MEELYFYLVAFVGGIIAGAVNTLAGNGSMITLAILTELAALPGNVANGTNRIGVFLNCLGGLRGFKNKGLFDQMQTISYVIPMFLGALVGLYFAIVVSNQHFFVVYKLLMLLLFFLILFKPKRWIVQDLEPTSLPYPTIAVLLFFLGIYGGFIQMGMGLFFLALMVWGARMPIMQANALKLLAVLLYTVVVLYIFHNKGLINWELGLVLGGAQFVGGWATAHFGMKIKNIERWTYHLFVLIVLVVLLKLFGVLHF